MSNVMRFVVESIICTTVLILLLSLFALVNIWIMSLLLFSLNNTHSLQLLADALPEPERATLSPLLLWGFEGSPFVRPVRETLSSLGLRHQLVNCARGSLNRDRLFQRTGRFQVPYLEDPNTGVRMFESGEIVKYLLAAYTTSTCSSISASATPTSTTISSSCGSTHGGVAGAL